MGFFGRGDASPRERMMKEHLEGRGIRSPAVLQAMETVPRERFLNPGAEDQAYQDRALPLSHGQTISQPYMVAVMSEALLLTGKEKVLEIGTGSGYQTAVLSLLAASVFSVERIEVLLTRAKETLAELQVSNVRVRLGDGTLGWEEEAPFHGILVTAGAPRPAPPSLLRQLSPEGGRLVIPLGDRNVQDLVRITRRGDNFREENLLACRFVPLVGEEGWED